MSQFILEICLFKGKCDKHEILIPHQPECESTCAYQCPVRSKRHVLIARPTCVCLPGYVRRSGECVPISYCDVPQPAFPPAPCDKTPAPCPTTTPKPCTTTPKPCPTTTPKPCTTTTPCPTTKPPCGCRTTCKPCHKCAAPCRSKCKCNTYHKSHPVFVDYFNYYY